MRFSSPLRVGFVSACLVWASVAQAFPDMMYYRFNEATGVGGTTANLASPFVGTAFAPVTGHTLAASGGIAGTGALLGATPASNANRVTTGWTTSFGSSSWTISFYADVSTDPSTLLHYAFGDNTAGSFRCFYRGVAGTGVMLRGPLTDVLIPNAGLGGPHHIAFVYDATIPAVHGYMDGVLAVTVNQAALNITGTTPNNFIVGGYGTSNSWGNGVMLDEFRMYSYALTSADIVATYLGEVNNVNILDVTQSGPGVGDLSISMTQLSPTATEGFMLISFETSNPVGTGPLFGVYPDAGTWELLLTTPLTDSNPVHFPVPSAFGGFPNNPFGVAPGALNFLAGTSADFAAMMFAPAFVYDSRSNVVRIAFQ